MHAPFVEVDMIGLLPAYLCLQLESDDVGVAHKAPLLFAGISDALLASFKQSIVDWT